MGFDIASALEAAELARALRDSVWAYPIVNAGHVFGIALLVGSIVPLDLRLLGLWPNTSVASLRQVLTVTAAAGLVIAVACGLLLFSTRATEYLGSKFFIAKMAVIAIGVINAATLRWRCNSAWLRSNAHATAIHLPVRVAAAVSLATWIAALVLGRLVGYF